MTHERPSRLPQPSFAPALMALGLMALLWGAVTSWLISLAGLIRVGGAAYRWIRDLGSEPQAALPESQDETQAASLAAAKAEMRTPVESLLFRPWLHRYAILLAVCTLALLVTGAIVTSHGAVASGSLRQVHIIVAAPVGLLSVGLALWLRNARGPAWLPRLGWIVVAGALGQAALGSQNPAVAVFHAWFAQLFFALTVAVAVVTGRRWIQNPEPVDDSGRLSLRTLSAVAVALMVVQVGLGAAVRHRAMSAVPHIAGALVVTIVLLLAAILVTQKFPEHPTLHPAAKALIGLTFTQVMLGMAAFITRLMAEEASLAVVIPSVAHVATGSLTLAAAVVLALQIRRNVRAAPARRTI